MLNRKPHSLYDSSVIRLNLLRLLGPSDLNITVKYNLNYKNLKLQHTI